MMISELEKALQCVLALEEIYSSKAKQHQNNINSPSVEINNNNNLAFYSPNFPLTGNSSIDVLLKGGVPRNTSNGNNNSNNNDFSQQQLDFNVNDQNQRQRQQLRKEKAKQNWKELDQILVKLCKHDYRQNNNNADHEEENRRTSKRILADVVKGRIDRWVRVATVAEKEAKKKEIQEFEKMMKDDDDSVYYYEKPLMQQQPNAVEVVLGSASSSVSRLILHTLLNS